jgi:hypothetical protein
MLEYLEPRIAPATLVNPTTVTYQDQNGDDVTIKLSKPIFAAASIANVLTFNVNSVDNSLPQQLQKVNLNGFQDPGAADGVSLSIVAKRSATHGGDGLANVGYIQAIGLPLGTVIVDGDLGQIEAGDSHAGIKALTVGSMGQYGLATQVGGDLFSIVNGKVGPVIVKGNMNGAALDIAGGVDGSLASITVYGSLLASSVAGSGSITTEGTMGPVKIMGSLIGDAGSSGRIASSGKLTSVYIGGDVIGGTAVVGNTDGQICAHGDMGPVTVLGNVIGHGANTGRIAADGKLSTVKIGGDLRGGEIYLAGTIQSGITASLGKAGAGAITIGGNVVSGAGDHTGALYINGPTPSVTIGGSILGSDAAMNLSEDQNGNLSVNRPVC